MTFDQWAMNVAGSYALRSRDESTQLGAVVFAGVKGALLSGGYNSFPKGVDDGVVARQKRPLKYSWMVHAEANAIYLAARQGISLHGGIIYVRWLPCCNCAMGIIQAGVKCVVVETFTVPERWQSNMRVAMTMLSEASVCVRLTDTPVTWPSPVWREQWI